MSTLIERRAFLNRLGSAAVGAAALAQAETTRGFFANDTIQVGAIGTGGRCSQLLDRLGKMPNVKVTAVCDIWEESLARGQKLADPQAATFTDYRELLARKDVDAVVIGSPDHWHVPMTIDACAAQKDVYVEKPLTHSLAEGAAVVEAQNKNQRIVQVGTQQRSMPQCQKAYELVKNGALGEVFKVHLSWNRNQDRWERGKSAIDPNTVRWKQFLGNAPEQPFDPYRFRNWRWFWDFGGGIFTDLMVHWIDVAHWFLGLDHPATAASIGDHFKAQELWETPDTVQTLLRYPDQMVQAYFEGTFVNARNASMIEFMGTEGSLYLDRGRYEFYPERRSKLPKSDFTPGTSPRGGDFDASVDGETYHLTNWLECVRSRQRPNCPAEAGVSAASAAHLANLSLRSGLTAKWPG